VSFITTHCKIYYALIFFSNPLILIRNNSSNFINFIKSETFETLQTSQTLVTPETLQTFQTFQSSQIHSYPPVCRIKIIASVSYIFNPTKRIPFESNK